MSALLRIAIVTTLGVSASSAAQAADPFTTLGAAGDYTLVSLADDGSGNAAGFLQLGSAAHVYGHVGGRYRIESAAGVIIEGDAHYGAGGALHGGTVQGSDALLDEATWEDLYDAAATTVDAADDLSATAISGAPTEQCTGAAPAVDSIGSLVLQVDRDDDGLSVYEIDGCLFLGSGETLLIEGTPDDRFVIRVTGGMRLERGSAIRLDGIPGSAVLFSLEGGGWSGESWAEVTVDDGLEGVGAELSGVFVSPDMYWQLGDGTLMPDTRIIAGGVQANIQDMNSTGPITGSPLEDEEDDDSDTCDDDPDCAFEGEPVDPCSLWGDRRLLADNDSYESDSNEEGIGMGDEHDRAPGGGCSAAALGASWLWLAGTGLVVTRRRRQA